MRTSNNEKGKKYLYENKRTGAITSEMPEELATFGQRTKNKITLSDWRFLVLHRIWANFFMILEIGSLFCATKNSSRGITYWTISCVVLVKHFLCNFCHYKLMKLFICSFFFETDYRVILLILFFFCNLFFCPEKLRVFL